MTGKNPDWEAGHIRTEGELFKKVSYISKLRDNRG